MKKKSPQYITLKEAAELSGYSADYIGQLIRKGKLPGTQVYSNVAWMTTHDAISGYLDQKQKKNIGAGEKIGRFSGIRESVGPKFLNKLYTAVVYAGIAVSIGLSVLLLYILFTGIEHSLQERALEDVTMRMR